MTEKEILNQLKKDFPKLISTQYPFPKPFKGSQEIKAIILGADPSHIVDGKPKLIDTVFGLDKEKSPYWTSMQRNIDQLQNLTRENVYVQNICRNYFTKETSNNKAWKTIATDYWLKLLKTELDKEFDEKIPVLMTTEFLLHALKKDKGKVKATDIYENCKVFPKDENLLGRELIAFYRHHKYSLKNWDEYRNVLDQKFKII